jgi:glycosyltransferase involved in cell wall biosynthesis
MMRVCSPHCGVSPETTSGGETYERELLTRLAGGGVRVELILARGKPHPVNVPNLTVHRFAIGRGLRWWVVPFVVPPAIARVHHAAGFDLLRVHSLRYIGPAALVARRRYRLDVPVVAHHHHLDPSLLNALVDKRVIAAVDRVVVGSEFARRQLARELGARTDHVEVVPYGVDARFAPRPARPELRARYDLGPGPTVLYFGGLKPRKNLPLLLEVWAAAARAHRDARLVIAGGGALLPSLRARAAALGAADSVRFTGYVPEAEKPDHFNLADVFLFPSAMEGFGLSVVEAMASGVPVIGSDRGSIPEILIDGEGGFVCDPADPTRFVERLQHLLAEGHLRQKLGAAARERTERLYRWDVCVDRTRQVYERAVEAWRRRRP